MVSGDIADGCDAAHGLCMGWPVNHQEIVAVDVAGLQGSFPMPYD